MLIVIPRWAPPLACLASTATENAYNSELQQSTLADSSRSEQVRVRRRACL